MMKALRCRERLYLLETSRAALVTIKQRLGFTLAAPAELLAELKADERFVGCGFIARAAALSEEQGFERGWRQAVAELTALDAAEAQLLSAVGSVLGKSDLETQQRQLELIYEQLSLLTSDFKSQYGDRRRLYYALGSLSGLAAAVLLL